LNGKIRYISSILSFLIPTRPVFLDMSSILKKFVPSTDDSLIYAEATGDPSKPALVFVPGLTMTTQVFDKQFLDEEMRKELYMVYLFSSPHHIL